MGIWFSSSGRGPDQMVGRPGGPTASRWARGTIRGSCSSSSSAFFTAAVGVVFLRVIDGRRARGRRRQQALHSGISAARPWPTPPPVRLGLLPLQPRGPTSPTAAYQQLLLAAHRLLRLLRRAVSRCCWASPAAPSPCSTSSSSTAGTAARTPAKAAVRAHPGYRRLEDQEFFDLTDRENPELFYSL